MAKAARKPRKPRAKALEQAPEPVTTGWRPDPVESALNDISAHLERLRSLMRVVEIEAQALPHETFGGNYTAGDVGCLAQIATEQLDAVEVALQKVIAMQR